MSKEKVNPYNKMRELVTVALANCEELDQPLILRFAHPSGSLAVWIHNPKTVKAPGAYAVAYSLISTDRKKRTNGGINTNNIDYVFSRLDGATFAAGKYQDIYFPLYGRYEVKEAGSVTIPGDVLELVGVSGRFDGEIFSNGRLFFKVYREGREPFEINHNPKSATARYEMGHYVGVAGVPLPVFTHMSGNHEKPGKWEEGENVFNSLCGLSGVTKRVMSFHLAKDGNHLEKYKSTALYLVEDSEPAKRLRGDE